MLQMAHGMAPRPLLLGHHISCSFAPGRAQPATWRVPAPALHQSRLWCEMRSEGMFQSSALRRAEPAIGQMPSIALTVCCSS